MCIRDSGGEAWLDSYEDTDAPPPAAQCDAGSYNTTQSVAAAAAIARNTKAVEELAPLLRSILEPTTGDADTFTDDTAAAAVVEWKTQAEAHEARVFTLRFDGYTALRRLVADERRERGIKRKGGAADVAVAHSGDNPLDLAVHPEYLHGNYHMVPGEYDGTPGSHAR